MAPLKNLCCLSAHPRTNYALLHILAITLPIHAGNEELPGVSKPGFQGHRTVLNRCFLRNTLLLGSWRYQKSHFIDLHLTQHQVQFSVVQRLASLILAVCLPACLPSCNICGFSCVCQCAVRDVSRRRTPAPHPSKDTCMQIVSDQKTNKRQIPRGIPRPPTLCLPVGLYRFPK